MTSVNRKWLPPVLIALAVLAAVAVHGRVPARVDLQIEALLLPFAVTQPPAAAPRWLALYLMPAAALVMWVAFRLAPTAAGQRLGRRMFPHAPAAVTSPAQFERFDRTYDAIVLGVVMLFLGLHAAVLAAALQAPGIALRIVPAVLGGSLVLLGNVMPRLRPNWVAGLRTQRMFENPQLWRSAHRVFGIAFVVSGLVTFGAAVVAPRYGLIVFLASVLASCVIGFVAATRQGGAARRAVIAVVGLLSAMTNSV